MAEVKDVVDEYPLSRDLSDFNRLNLQHYLWKTIFGYSIHPSILRNQTNLKVADVGTGTGIWLLELASQLDTSAELFGLDSDITQVAPPEWLPANVKLREWNAFTEPPEDLKGTFDIVHIRLFAFVIEDDPTPVLQNLTKLLKPGGYLQWGEIDVSSMRIVSSTPEVPTDSLAELWEKTIPQGTRMLPSWAKFLQQRFKDEGLVDVEEDWQEGNRYIGLAMHYCNMQIHDMVAARLRTRNSQKAADIDRVFREAVTQSRKGAAYLFDKAIFIGRKPN